MLVSRTALLSLYVYLYIVIVILWIHSLVWLNNSITHNIIEIKAKAKKSNFYYNFKESVEDFKEELEARDFYIG